MQQLEKSIAEMRDCMLNESSSGKQIASEMQTKLVEAHKRLLDVQSQLHSTESELEKKFSQTAAYKNMKQMLNKKNKQMKELRTKLVKYEPNQGDGSGNEEDD
jgi:leucine zipper transcription factor-like protein 1